MSAPERMGMQMRATELAASRSPSASPRSCGGAALERREAGQVRSSATAGMKGARTSLFRVRGRVRVRARTDQTVASEGKAARHRVAQAKQRSPVSAAVRSDSLWYVAW
eukprot:scaffold73807_cov60-Phaeocystis_antarctica.AAC.2